MKRSYLTILVIVSLALNVGVFATIGVHKFGEWTEHDGPRGHGMLVDYLELSDEQRSRWVAKERVFMERLAAAWLEIRQHRERMIREVFSAHPSHEAIEAERAAILRLQEGQQQRVIEQLMAEREILEPEQQRRLADLLLEQNPTGSMEEFLTHEIRRP